MHRVSLEIWKGGVKEGRTTMGTIEDLVRRVADGENERVWRDGR